MVARQSSTQMTGRPRAAVVVNEMKVDLDALRRLVAAEETRGGWGETLWFPTSAADPGQLAARRARAAGAALVVIVGGDGTVRAVVEELADSGLPLGLVPAGTGNLLARALGLPLNDLPGSIETAFDGGTRTIDVAQIELRREDDTVDRHSYLVMAGIGLDAQMAAHTNAAVKKRVGWLAYVHPIAASVLGAKQLYLHYRLDGSRVRSVRAHTVIVGNSGTLPGNLLLLPDAAVDDGLLDVVVLRPNGFGGWVQIASRLSLTGPIRRIRGGRTVLGWVPASPSLQYARAKEFVVRFNLPQEIQLDGDPFGSVIGVRIRVQHHALTIGVPTSRPVGDVSAIGSDGVDE